MKSFFRNFYLTSKQILIFIKLSKLTSKLPIIGKPLSIILDNTILFIFSAEMTSSSINVKELIIGHSTGVVLGGNGIKCNGKLHISSGVVFGRRYNNNKEGETAKPMFNINGDLTVGANSVLLGPLNINGPVIIGAMSLVTKDIEEPGIYVGIPVKKIQDIST